MSLSTAGVSSARPTVVENVPESSTVRSAQNDVFAATTIGISSTRRMAARPVRSMRQSKSRGPGPSFRGRRP